MEELVEVFFPGGALLAIGVAIGATFSKQLRPIAKQALKAGLALGDQVRVAAAEASERAQDLVAEAKAERAAELNGPPAEHPAARAKRTS